MATIYCVETFWKSAKRWERAQLRQFGDESEARQTGKALSARMPGVLVYSVTGEPSADYWEDPAIIARYGDVPAEAA